MAEMELAAPDAGATVYACPMHPEVTSDKPGKCPKCGMALVLRSEAQRPDAGSLKAATPPPAAAPAGHAHTHAATAPADAGAALYACPMHPEVTSAHPGDCPRCGMHLVLQPHGATP